MDLASVHDSPGRLVRHLVDGQQVSEEPIAPQHLAKTIRFGNVEVGNWGQPYRKTSAFAVRNLHGAIDEVMLFRTALTGQEIAEIYRAGSADTRVKKP